MPIASKEYIETPINVGTYENLCVFSKLSSNSLLWKMCSKL